MSFVFRWLDALLLALGLKNKQARIVILGLDNAGKSTLVHKLCTNEIRSFVPTTKAHSKTFTMGRIEFTAWDLGGHEQVRDLWQDFYSNADAIVFMVDSADKARFNEAKKELDQILDADELKPVPILIFGNKCDLQESEGRDGLITKLAVDKYFDDSDEDERTLEVFSCSLVTGAGYTEGFKWLSSYL